MNKNIVNLIVARILEEKPYLSKEYVEKLIYEKICSFRGLISEEVAAYIVAKEIGVRVNDILEASEDKSLSRKYLETSRNIILEAKVLDVRERKEEILAKVLASNGKICEIIIPKHYQNIIQRGKCLKFISLNLIQSSNKGTLRYVLDRKHGRIIECSRDVEYEFISGIIVKKTEVKIRQDTYTIIVILKSGSNYIPLMIKSRLRAPLEDISLGLTIETIARKLGNILITNLENVKVKGVCKQKDPYYNKPIKPSEVPFKPLKYVDIIGEVKYIGKTVKVEDRGEIFKDIIIGDEKTNLKLRVWGTLAQNINSNILGKNVIFRNVNVKMSKKGPYLSTSSISSLEILK